MVLATVGWIDDPIDEPTLISQREDLSMSTHDEARRKFLVGAAVGAGAVATGGLSSEVLAQAQPAAPVQQVAAEHAAHTAGGKGLGAFLNADNAEAVAAFTERLMPGAPGKPGARDANVANYIDLALAGAYSDMQDFYRRGLQALDAYCQKTFKKSFVELSVAQQDEVIGALEQGKASEFTWPSQQQFFNTLRTHTIEGMFADPVYGGNKDFAGWKLVGFPGAYPAFTPADMQSKEAFAGATYLGLQSQASRSRG
jgi:gluconate 2-dehydrogenase gamma chain